MKQSLII